MNYVKNEFRSLLTQENLNTCMSLGMTLHSVHTFPFSYILKKVGKCARFMSIFHFSFFYHWHWCRITIKIAKATVLLAAPMRFVELQVQPL